MAKTQMQVYDTDSGVVQDKEQNCFIIIFIIIIIIIFFLISV